MYHCSVAIIYWANPFFTPYMHLCWIEKRTTSFGICNVFSHRQRGGMSMECKLILWRTRQLLNVLLDALHYHFSGTSGVNFLFFTFRLFCQLKVEHLSQRWSQHRRNFYVNFYLMMSELINMKTKKQEQENVNIFVSLDCRTLQSFLRLVHETVSWTSK